MESKCTVLICSCDAYSDTWQPFFTLFEKYWPSCSFPILLNTESLPPPQFVECNVASLQRHDTNTPYGRRMIDYLHAVETPYTLVLLDDFFIRRTVNVGFLEKVIEWMENDDRAVVFNFQPVKDMLNEKSVSYDGFEKRPVYGEYKYNFQAAIWRTDYLLNAWKPNDTPWTWETLGNYRSFNSKYDFYVLNSSQETPIDYGYNFSGMGIFRGKWVIDSVEELFNDNGIKIDYSIRGIYTKENKNTCRTKEYDGLLGEVNLFRCIGPLLYLRMLVWRIRRIIRLLFGMQIHGDWIEYLRTGVM